jgi:hypothetical protein
MRLGGNHKESEDKYLEGNGCERSSHSTSRFYSLFWDPVFPQATTASFQMFTYS